MRISPAKVIGITIIPLLFLLGKLILVEDKKNKISEPIYGDFISKPSYLIHGDQWPFTVEKAAIFCKGSKGNYSLYLETKNKFYSLDKKSKEQLGYPLPYEILRTNLNPNLAKQGFKFNYERITSRAKGNCINLEKNTK